MTLPRFALSVLLLVLVLAPPASAQDAPADTLRADSLAAPPPPAPEPAPTEALKAPPRALPTGGSGDSPVPTRPQLIDWRRDSEVRAERENYTRYVTAAEVEQAAARTRVIQAKARFDIKKGEITALDARIKAAKQAKLESERKNLESERRRLEAMRDYFERMFDVESARTELAAAQVDFGKSLLREVDLELQLLGVRAGTVDDGALLKLEQQYLEAHRVRAAAQERLAQREQAGVERRLRVYRAWMAYLGGR
jgi:hypothetical protein